MTTKTTHPPSMSSLLAHLKVYRAWAIVSLPVGLSYLIIGATFGVLAQKNELNCLATMAMSLFIYSGSAQFIAIGMLGLNQSPILIALSVLIVNMRHFLYAFSILPHLKTFTCAKKILYGLQLTDESFAIHSTTWIPNRTNTTSVFCMHFFFHLTWVLGTLVGYILGEGALDLTFVDGDFALAALFVGILTGIIKYPIHGVIIISSVLLTLLMAETGFKQFSVLVVGMLGALIGVYLDQWATQK